jgi:N-methylhydantoinase A/oxoprolinase/acetone carboxylase beta subunit
MKKYILGIDIGGTNTDAVIIDVNRSIHAACKVSTENPLSSGLSKAIKKVLKDACLDRSSIDSIVVGTTHATNAIVQRSNLSQVGIIRLTALSTSLLPSAYNWPTDLYRSCIAQAISIGGGYECDGRLTGTVKKCDVIDACEKCIDAGAESIALIGVFSPLYKEQEITARQYIYQEFGTQLPVSISSDIGTIGIIERENATILNAALGACIDKEFSQFVDVCAQLCDAPVYITQNNGAIISVEMARQLPVLTIASGPTNSCMGGAALSMCQDAVIVDIGGTTTDVGAVKNGFARRSLNTSNIGGVPINFPMPDVLSVAVGGGSIISYENNMVIGPRSLGSQMVQQARSFGGSYLTLTDCALKLGYARGLHACTSDIGFSSADARRVFDCAKAKILPLIAKMKGQHKNLPVILVGGGATLFPEKFFGAAEIVPEYASVANAYGAACAQISATIDSVICMDNHDYEIALMAENARVQAVARGALAHTVHVVQKDIIPYSYVPGNKARVIITVAGDRF